MDHRSPHFLDISANAERLHDTIASRLTTSQKGWRIAPRSRATVAISRLLQS